MDYPYIHPKYLSTTCHRFNGGPCAAHKNNNDSLFTQLIRRFYRAPWIVGWNSPSWRFDPGTDHDLFFSLRFCPLSFHQNYSPNLPWNLTEFYRKASISRRVVRKFSTQPGFFHRDEWKITRDREICAQNRRIEDKLIKKISKEWRGDVGCNIIRLKNLSPFIQEGKQYPLIDRPLQFYPLTAKQPFPPIWSGNSPSRVLKTPRKASRFEFPGWF